MFKIVLSKLCWVMITKCLNIREYTKCLNIREYAKCLNIREYAKCIDENAYDHYNLYI